MKILLDAGKANVNAKSKVLSTPLHYSVWKGHIEAATLLIERGADINPIDKYNRTPLDRAHESNFTAMTAFLESNFKAMIAFLKTKGAVRAPHPVFCERG